MEPLQGKYIFICVFSPQRFERAIRKRPTRKIHFEKIVEKEHRLRNAWRTQTHLQPGLIVVTDTCTELEIYFDDMKSQLGRRARPQKGEHYINFERKVGVPFVDFVYLFVFCFDI